MRQQQASLCSQTSLVLVNVTHLFSIISENSEPTTKEVWSPPRSSLRSEVNFLHWATHFGSSAAASSLGSRLALLELREPRRSPDTNPCSRAVSPIDKCPLRCPSLPVVCGGCGESPTTSPPAARRPPRSPAPPGQGGAPLISAGWPSVTTTTSPPAACQLPCGPAPSGRVRHLAYLARPMLLLAQRAGNDFIPNIDFFWNNSCLYKNDGVHQNRLGTKQLTTNFIQFIASN